MSTALPKAEATDGTWINSTTNSTWGTTANWSGGSIANGIGATANFNTLDILANRTVSLSQVAGWTVGTLNFGDTETVATGANWTVATGTGGTLTLATSAGTPTINVITQTTTISAVLAGNQGFTKSGAGTLSLTGANTITGGINLSQGVLTFGVNTLNNNLVTFTSTATLTWGTANAQDVSSLIKINDGVTATLSSGASNTITLATALQLGAAGTAAVTKIGAGTIVLTAANTWTGLTTVTNGTLVLAGGDNRLLSGGSVGLGTTANSGILQLGDAGGAISQTVSSLTVTGGASSTSNAVVGGNAAVSTLIINNAAADTYSGFLGGAGTNQNNLAIVKNGAGNLTLSNTGSTFTGGVNINQGTVTFANGGLGNSGLISFLAASTLQWSAGNAQDISSRIKISDGVLATLDTNSNTVTLATALQTGPLGTGGLTKGGGGTLVLTAANTYTGNTRINNGRLILTGGDNRVASTVLQFGSNANSGILQLGDASGPSNQTVSNLLITGNATSVNNAIVGGNAAISTLTINNSATVTWAQFLGGPGTNENNLALTKSGVGTLTLSGANTFVGNVSINAGTVAIKGSSSLGGGTKTVFINGATAGPSLKLDGSTSDISLAAGISFVTSNDDAATPAILSSAGNNIIAGSIALTSGGFGTGDTRITVNGGTLILNGGIAPLTGAASARKLILDGTANGTANGIIADNGALGLAINKQGSGTWTLTAANSYSGATQIDAGRLNITTAQTGGGALSLADGAALGVTLAGAGQTLNVASLTLGTTTGTILNFDLASFSNPAVSVITTGAFTINGASTINVAGTALSVGFFDLIKYTGSIGGTGYAGLALGTLPARVTAELVDNSAGSSVQLHITAFDVPKWTGANGNIWDINDGPDPTTGSGTVNWKEATSGIATRYLQIGSTVDSVLFDNSASLFDVNLSTNLTPTSATVNNDLLHTYTFSGTGKLSGATSLVKQGTGTLILANTGGNDYTGTTTISGGTLQAGDGVTLFAGQLGSGNIINNGTLVLNRPAGDDFTFSNAISGSGTLTQQGGNTVVLAGNNGSYDGAIIVAAGALRVGSVNALGTAVGGVTVQSGGALELTGQVVADSILLNGGTLRTFSGNNNNLTSTLTLNGGGTIDQFNSTVLTVGTVITGTGGLTKSGNGTLILTAANNYTGGTTITGGIVQIGLTNGTSTTGWVGSGNIDFAATSGNSATLTILRADNGLDVTNNITSTGAGTNAIIIGFGAATSPSGTVTFSGTNSFTGNVTISGGALRITNSSALGTGTKTVSIGNASGPALKIDGTGGDITLAAGINFTISSDGTIVNAASNSGAIVNLAGNNVINGNIAVINGGGGQGRVFVQGGTLTINGNVDSTGSTGNRTLVLGGPGNGTVNGIIADAAFTTGVTKDGTGTWTLTGNNTFTGAVAAQAGTLQINNLAALGLATSAITIGTATTEGTLEYTGSGDATLARAITVNGVGGGVIKNSGGAVLTLSGTLTKNGRTLTLTGGIINVSGVIAGATASDLIINNSTVTLSNTANTFNGALYIYGGGILKNGATEVLPNTTTLILGEATGNTGGTFDLNGFNETLISLSSAGSGAKTITNGGATGTNTLTITSGGSYDGVIADGATASIALTKSGAGLLALTGVNTFTGALVISAGTLQAGNTGALGNGLSAILLGSTSLGTLEYIGTSATLSRDITVGGAGGGVIKNSGGGTLTLGGTLTKNGVMLTLSGGAFNVTGKITGAAANSDLVVNNSAMVTLTNANNDYNGPTLVNGGGILKNGVTNALPTGTLLTLGEATNSTAGTYDLNGFDASIAGLNSAGSGANVVTNSAASGTNTLTITSSGSFGGSIKDGTTAKTALTKSGSGVQTLTSVNSYTGDTTINSGTIDLASPALITSNATVKAGGTLINSGTVEGSVTVQSGGSLYTTEALATSLATFHGSLALDPGADWFFDIGGVSRGSSLSDGYDAVNGITQLSLGGTLHVNLINSYAPLEGAIFNLLDWTNLSNPANVNGAGLTFDFSNASLTSGLSWDTSNFLTSGNVSVVAAVAPEPGRAALLAAGSLVLLLRRRR